MIRILLMTAAVMALSGCARVIEGSSQSMTIETPGANGATCFIENQEFRYKIYAPQTIRITRSYYPFDVRCLAPGNRQKTVTVAPKIQEATYMNAANGFIPGMLVDYNTRSFYKFPELVIVDFTDMAPRQMPAPHHDKLLKENPHLRGMEEFRPGLPALQRDAYDEAQPLRPRVMPGAESAPAPSAVTPEPLDYAPMPLPPASGARNGDAESLTRQMNPSIFGGDAPMPLMRDDSWTK